MLLLVGPGDKPVAARPAPLGEPATPAKTATRYAEVLRRGYALVVFNPNDCAEDTTLRNADGSWAFRNTRFYPAYPGYDWGILGGGAWGASRVADYLQSVSGIDKSRLIVTGASCFGKAAIVAAAFDERFMAAPVLTGGGGVGAYRFAGPRGSETLDLMEKKYPNWFSPNLHQFRGQRDKLPFDQHWFLALCAPRPAYELLGVPDRIGVNYGRHGHAFTDEDWTALMDFADKHLRGLAVDRPFGRFPTDAEVDAASAAGVR